MYVSAATMMSAGHKVRFSQPVVAQFIIAYWRSRNGTGHPRPTNVARVRAFYSPYSKMAADLCAYKLALVASFKIKYSFEF